MEKNGKVSRRFELVALKQTASRWCRTQTQTHAMTSDSPCQVLRTAYHIMWELQCTSVMVYRLENPDTGRRRYLGSCGLNSTFVSADGRYWLFTGDERRYLERIDRPQW